MDIRAQSLSYSAKRNLVEDVREYLQNEKGMTTLQARHVIESRDSKDMSIVNDAFMEVSSRARSSPSSQMIKQNPNLVTFRNKDLRGEYIVITDYISVAILISNYYI